VPTSSAPKQTIFIAKPAQFAIKTRFDWLILVRMNHYGANIGANQRDLHFGAGLLKAGNGPIPRSNIANPVPKRTTLKDRV
jgi:hypothetical protein